MPETVLYLDSSVSNRAAGSAKFVYRMSPALFIPQNTSPVLKVVEADLPYTSPNVSAAKSNNKLKFAIWSGGNFETAYPNSATTSLEDALTDYKVHTIEFPDGLYALADIESVVQNFIQSDTTLQDFAITFQGINATQKVQIDFDQANNNYGVVFFWDETDSIGKLLGFTADSSNDYTHVVEHTRYVKHNLFDIGNSHFDTNTPENHYYFTGDEVAHFDAVSHYLLQLSCVDDTNYGSGGSFSQAVCAITPDVTPGSWIRYRPVYGGLPCACSQLAGTRTSAIQVRLTDNSGGDIYLAEGFTARVIISY